MSSEDFGLLRKTSGFFGNLRKWSCLLQKSTTPRMVLSWCTGSQGNNHFLSLSRSHWLAVLYYSVLCSGSCEPVHEDRTPRIKISRLCLRKSWQVYFTDKTELQVKLQVTVHFFLLLITLILLYLATKTIIQLTYPSDYNVCQQTKVWIVLSHQVEGFRDRSRLAIRPVISKFLAPDPLERYQNPHMLWKTLILIKRNDTS